MSTDTFTALVGRKVVHRSDAEEMGAVKHVLINAGERRISALVIGHGKKAHLVDWSDLSNVGPDAVIIAEGGSVRVPADELEKAAASGSLDLVGRRVLTVEGNQLGTVPDVSFDPATGSVESLQVGSDVLPAGTLRGSGSYATVVDQSVA